MITLDDKSKRELFVRDSRLQFQENGRLLTLIITADADEYIYNIVSNQVSGSHWHKIFIVTSDRELMNGLNDTIENIFLKNLEIKTLEPDCSFLPKTINVMKIMREGTKYVPDIKKSKGGYKRKRTKRKAKKWQK